MKPLGYSAIQTFQRCPRRYWYSRVEEITSPSPNLKIDVGTWMHLLLGEWYINGDHAAWQELHNSLKRDYTAAYPDAEEVADMVEALMHRYLDHYHDADSVFKVVAVEETFEFDGITFTPDLIVEGKTGLWVVDHKTTGNAISDDEMKLIDPQKLAYIEGLQSLLHWKPIRGFIFNWIRRKLPTVPTLRKDGQISRINQIDTDYETLRDFALDNKITPYPELTARLEELKTGPSKFFHREYIHTGRIEGYLANLKKSAETIYATGETIDDFPMHIDTLPGIRSCHGCEFSNLCFSEVMGMDYEEVRLTYRRRPAKGQLT